MTTYSAMFVTCPECGAQCSGSSTVCWICQAPLSGSETAGRESSTSTFVANRDLSRAASRPSNASATAVEGGDAVALVVLFVAVIAVGAGLALESPGLVIPFAIVATPAALLTMRKHSRRQASQGSVGWADVLADFLGAIATTIGVLILLVVVLFIALAAFCFVMISSGSFR